MLNRKKRRKLASVVGGEILFMVTEGMTRWLDQYNARIVGESEGKVILALEDEDWKKFYKDLFKEEYDEVA
jgi:hypothetical protein